MRTLLVVMLRNFTDDPAYLIDITHKYTSHEEAADAIREAVLDWSNKQGGDFPEDYNYGDLYQDFMDMTFPGITNITMTEVSSIGYTVDHDEVLIHKNEEES